MESNLQKIEHIVVLMLENRSFDNMLGFLGASDAGGQKVNGVAGKQLSNPIPEYAQTDHGPGSVPIGFETDMTNPNPDPGEEYAHVNTQLFGEVIPPENRYPQFDEKPQEPYNLPTLESYTNPPMNGFVTDYINHFNAVMKGMPKYEQYKVIMNCHTEETLPVLHALAKQYAVFDAWFASVPSQTICNRFFLHTGTSHGYVLNVPYYHWPMLDTPTIFNRLADNRISWRIYYDKDDVVSFTGLLHRPLWKYRKTNFFHMDDFENDAKQGELPSYSFIEPRFFMSHNDQHPPIGNQSLGTSNVLAGELLIHRVYDVLRKSPRWNQTLLIITYDEHGGCYDHVPPPAAVPPDASVSKEGFKFDRLGVRVPTVMVSPYIDPGTVVSDTCDHTSIIKTICERWSLPPLTERDKHANSFAKVLNRESPRVDNPPIEPRKYAMSRAMLDEPINPLQRAILFIMAGYEDALRMIEDQGIFEKVEDLFQLVLDERRIAHIKTVGQAIHFSIAFDRRVTKHLSFLNWLRIKIRLLLRV
ncbi:MAG TPA: alkaline phosphatase family protein [Anaerolineales bacterium]|nr:alkaline phosphatase family protein [Anaerolineales bacterium]